MDWILLSACIILLAYIIIVAIVHYKYKKFKSIYKSKIDPTQGVPSLYTRTKGQAWAMRPCCHTNCNDADFNNFVWCKNCPIRKNFVKWCLVQLEGKKLWIINDMKKDKSNFKIHSNKITFFYYFLPIFFIF